MAAIKAGKHIYLEKPIAHTIEEGAEIVKAAEKSGKILQVGTQNRSNPLYQKAKEMVAQGMIGDVHYVRAFWYRNFPSGTDAGALALRHSRRTPASQHATGPSSSAPPPSAPSTSAATSSGATTGTTRAASPPTCWCTRPTSPTSCWARPCPSPAWLGRHLPWGPPDDREAPDTLSAIYEYADKFHLNYSCFFRNDHFGYGEQFMGYEGTIEVLNRTELHFYPQKFGGKAPPRVAARAEVHVKEADGQPQRGAPHPQLPRSPSAARRSPSRRRGGQIAAIPGHMATLSYKNNKKIYWDAKTEKYSFT